MPANDIGAIICALDVEGRHSDADVVRRFAESFDLHRQKSEAFKRTALDMIEERSANHERIVGAHSPAECTWCLNVERIYRLARNESDFPPTPREAFLAEALLKVLRRAGVIADSVGAATGPQLLVAAADYVDSANGRPRNPAAILPCMCDPEVGFRCRECYLEELDTEVGAVLNSFGPYLVNSRPSGGMVNNAESLVLSIMKMRNALDAVTREKQENDERLMLERDEARSDVNMLRAHVQYIADSLIGRTPSLPTPEPGEIGSFQG